TRTATGWSSCRGGSASGCRKRCRIRRASQGM
ncbi:MAG TPA: hypothetical protein DEH09_15175, partial [Alcanivorax sp.]|nr:hypothetical protein [Alcanivorax sp.]